MITPNWSAEKYTPEEVAGKSLRRFGVDSLLSAYPSLDTFDTSRYVLSVDQPSLALPRDFYMDQETYADYIEAYKTYIVDVARVFVRETTAGISDEELRQHAEELFAFEYRLARVKRRLNKISLS